MKKRILFVDDEPKVLNGLQRMLHNQTDVWDMAYATGAADATDLLAQKRYDAVVLDINMPGKNGLELLAEIKAGAQTQDIEVVMLTGLQDQNLKRQALDLGAADLLNKPVLKEDLMARLNSVLRIKAYHDELQIQNAVLERQLLQSQRMELIGMLAASLMGDLNDILSAIMKDSDFITQVLSDNLKIQKNLKDIEDAAQHAWKILTHVLGFIGQTEAEREPCNLGSVIDECLELLQLSIPKGVVIKWDGPQTNRSIQVSVIEIYQMLLNLCINAAHAMEHEGILRISLTETELDADSVPPGREIPPGPYLRLEISDTGVEIDQATLKHMTVPLFTTRDAQKGVDLSLSVAQRIARNHGGLMTVEGIPEKGTAFLVYLPCARDRSAPDQAEKD